MIEGHVFQDRAWNKHGCGCLAIKVSPCKFQSCRKLTDYFVRVFANFSGSVIRFADQELVRRQEILPDVYLK